MFRKILKGNPFRSLLWPRVLYDAEQQNRKINIVKHCNGSSMNSHMSETQYFLFTLFPNYSFFFRHYKTSIFERFAPLNIQGYS